MKIYHVGFYPPIGAFFKNKKDALSVARKINKSIKKSDRIRLLVSVHAIDKI